MTTLSLTNCEILVGGTDMSSFLNKATLTAKVAELDVTTFGSTYHTRIGGLKDSSLAWDGFWTSLPDAAQFAQLGTANQVITVCPQGLEQTTAYLFQADQFTYDQFGKVGDAAPFSATIAGSDSVTGLVQGQLAALTRSVSATGQVGSILTIAGPAGASNFVYAALHVTAAATTITIQIQSAPAANFAAPTTRGTIGPITVTGGTWMVRVPGPITDGFWRANCSAQTGTFVISCSIGIK